MRTLHLGIGLLILILGFIIFANQRVRADDQHKKMTARVVALSSVSETQPDTSFQNRSLSQTLTQTIYFPMLLNIRTPSYLEDFTDSDHGWYEGESDEGYCDSGWNNGNGRYDISLTNEWVCFRPAFKTSLQEPSRRYGEFSVDLGTYRNTQPYSFGLYTNAKGGDEHYLFLIGFTQDRQCGDWTFIKRVDGINQVLLEGDCQDMDNNGQLLPHTDPLLNNDPHRLAIHHLSAGQLQLMIDHTTVSWVDNTNTVINLYDDDNALNGSGNGVYVRAHRADGVEVWVDNFLVIRR
ncbi:MAG: hypothetical protein AAF629_23205 [Chloroflexota bacterium]